MKQVIIFLMALLMFISIKSFAQVKPAQAQYLKEKGVFLNPGFEQGYKGWTVSGCTKSLETDVPFLGKSLKLSCTAETFSVIQDTTELAGTNLKSFAGCKVKADAAGVKIRTRANAVGNPETTVSGSDYNRFEDDFTADATSNGLEIYADAAFTGNVYIEDCYVGLTPDGFNASVTTTQGDLIIRGASEDERLPLSGNIGYLLTETAAGAAWMAAPTSVTVSAAGEIQTHNATVPTSLAAPTSSNLYLVSDEDEPTKMKWSDFINASIAGANEFARVRIPASFSGSCDWFDRSTTGYQTPQSNVNCGSANIIDGNITMADTRVPSFNLTNVTVGNTYKLDISNIIYKYTTSTNIDCATRVKVDGVDIKLHNLFKGTSGGGVLNGKFHGQITFTAASSGTIPVVFQISENVLNSCQIDTRLQEWRMSVTELPPNESVVAQKQRLLKVKAKDLVGGTSTTSFAYNYVNSVTELHDDLNALTDTGDIVFTVPAGYAGHYEFDFGARVDLNGPVAGMECGLTITGGTTTSKALTIATSANQHYLKCVFEDIELNVGDTVKFYSRKGGTNTVTWVSDDRFNYLEINQKSRDLTVIGNFGECVTNYLSADITTDTADITDLKYTNLKIGERYQLYITLKTGGSFVGLDNIILSNGICNNTNSKEVNFQTELSTVVCPPFTASSNTMTFGGSSISSGNAIEGNGTASETYVTICELRKEIN